MLTFGASWDNKSGVDFLNRDSSSGSDAVGAGVGTATGSAAFKVGKNITINTKASSKGGSGSTRQVKSCHVESYHVMQNSFSTTAVELMW